MEENISGLHHNGYIKKVFSRIHFCNKYMENLKYTFFKNKDSYVNKSFLNNISNMYKYYIKCNTPKELIILDGLLDDNIMQMINAGNINNAIDMLGCDKVNETNLIKTYTKKSYNEIDSVKEVIKNLFH